MEEWVDLSSYSAMGVWGRGGAGGGGREGGGKGEGMNEGEVAGDEKEEAEAQRFRSDLWWLSRRLASFIGFKQNVFIHRNHQLDK